MRLPILRGPLRGRWWLVTSRGRVLRILLGSYEPEQTRIFHQHVRPGGTLLDVGAHAGYYTLLGAAQVGPTGKVWSLEPHPRNARYLRRHVEINRLDNVRVEQAAAADHEGVARFGGGSGSGTGRLTGGGELEVRTLTIDDLCRRNQLRPTAIKLDVEGAEGRAIAGATETLRESRPVVFLSTHGPHVHADAIDRLQALGYTILGIGDAPLAASTELLCLPPGR